MSGTLVKVSGNTLRLSNDSGAESDHVVADGASVTLNGDESSLSDLRAGDVVKLSGKPATTVVATR